MSHLHKIFQYVWPYLQMNCVCSHIMNAVNIKNTELAVKLIPACLRGESRWYHCCLYISPEKNTDCINTPIMIRPHKQGFTIVKWDISEEEKKWSKDYLRLGSILGNTFKLFMSVWLDLCIDSRVSSLSCWLWKVALYDTGSRSGSIFGVIYCWWRSPW